MEALLFRKIELWVGLLVLILVFVGWVFFSWTLKNELESQQEPEGIGAAALSLASVPDNLAHLIESGIDIGEDGTLVERNPQILSGDYERNLNINDADFSDEGYLLISAYSHEDRINVVQLFDISASSVVWQWKPDPQAVVDSSPMLRAEQERGTLDPIETRELFRSQSPLLMADGSVVVTSGEGSLSRWSACGDLIWANDRHFHHSIETANDGVIVPIIVDDPEPAPFKAGLRDDGYAIVDRDGKIISETSILDILYANGRFHTVLGRNVGDDPIHLNDAEIIKTSDAFVSAGDIMLSSRHLSAVLLYRPSSNEIVWYKAGPWLAQHDMDYLGDGRFSLYGNDNSLSVAGLTWPHDHSTVYIYDMARDVVETPYDAVFEALDIRDASSSTHRVLRNGDVFVERSTSGILWRLSPEGPRWHYVNRTADGIGAMQWSRYLYRDEIDLTWMDETTCDQ
ncbi:arylsulfotransferase family protein [Pararhizobium haloflavum]|uniref:arylsulfotransferase family protein n=1 Tax=Pararhizobium haloflavum TaxID=2037914 RepID=UPI000C188B2B|nr:arylsulfotransferase family protein [Pararhizobium haloflavum]